jgi:chaperonin GroEL
VNNIRGSLRVAAVRAPGYGEQRESVLQDIAILTGGKAVTESLGLRLQNIQISDLGHAKKITIDKNNTVVEGRSMCDHFAL